MTKSYELKTTISHYQRLLHSIAYYHAISLAQAVLGLQLSASEKEKPMKPALKNLLVAVGVAIVAGVVANLVLRMILKKKTNPDGSSSTKLFGKIGIDGAICLDGYDE
jgi:hypothetical protein